MSSILDLQEEILEVTARTRDLERTVAQYPQSRSLLLMLKSAQQRLHELEEEFEAETNQLGVEICSYRLFSATNRYLATAVFEAISRFQAAVSATYSSLSSQNRRKKGRRSPKVTAATSFDFGYMFSGSLGFVLTIPNERLLVVESHLDKSIQTVFDVAGCHEPAQVAEYAKTLGPAPIRAIYNWSHTHAESGLGADIEWRRGSEIRNSLFVQPTDLYQLATIIELAGEEQRTELTRDGLLVAVNTKRRTFQFLSDREENFSGSYSDAITLTNPSQVPRRYRVKIEKVTKVRYSMETEEVTYRLIYLVSPL